MEDNKNYLKLGQLYDILETEKDTSTLLNNIELILISGYDINYRVEPNSFSDTFYSGYTALHFAVEYELLSLIELLLRYRADVTCKANNGFTPLRFAVEEFKNSNKSWKIGNAMINQMLSSQLNTGNATNPCCKNGISHFHIACMANKTQLVQFFCKSGVDVNESVNADSLFFPGYTSLHFAVRRGCKKTCSFLLKAGADIGRVDGNGMTPIQLAVNRMINIKDCLNFAKHDIDKKRLYKYEAGIIESIIAMLTKATEASCSNPVDGIGLSLFHVSCVRQDYNSEDRVKRCLDLGADINAPVSLDSRTWPGYTPLHFAAHCNLQTLMFLLKNGANLAAKDANGITPFDLCIERYKPIDVAEILETQTSEHTWLANDTNVLDAIRAIDTSDELDYFLRTTNVHTLIPFDSILWPGYTVFHLVVALSKIKKKFDFDFFAEKDYLNKHNSSWCDDDVFVNICLLRGVDFTIQDANGMTPLHLAFRMGKRRIVRAILSDHMDIMAPLVDHEGLSHLHIACVLNNAKLVERFLHYGLDSNSPLKGDIFWYNFEYKLTSIKAGSTLHDIAVIFDGLDTIKLLFNNNAKLSPNLNGLTPVHMGFISSSWASVKLVLSFPEARKINYTTKTGLSHLHVACQMDHLEAVTALISVPVNINEQIKYDPLDTYAENLAPYAGYTPLHFAVLANSTAIVDLLINRGADIRIKNAQGLNSFHMALQGRHHNDALIKRFFLELNGTEWQDEFGLTRLHIAGVFNDINMLETLLKSGENVNSQVHMDSPVQPGDTPLHFWINRSWTNMFRNSVCLQLLLKYGVDITLKNAANSTPLLLFYKFNDKTGLSNLLSTTMSPLHQHSDKFFRDDSANKYGVSHFHLSCFCGNLETTEKFLQSGVDINQFTSCFSNYRGVTPLHIAIRERHSDLIKLLLKYWADFTIENIKGFTALHEAAMNFPDSLENILSTVKFDLQAENVFGKTVLETLLDNKDASSRCFRVLIEHGARMNFVMPLVKKKYVTMAAWKLDKEIFQLLVDQAHDLTHINVDGHNAVFNAVSFPIGNCQHMTIKRYGCNIEILLNSGCELDHQDNQGKTALHAAVSTGNISGVMALLFVGADVNIIDSYGKTPCAYSSQDNSFLSIMLKLLEHMFRLKTAGLFVNAPNEQILGKYLYRFKTDLYRNELQKMKMTSVTKSLTLRDLLSEQMIICYMTMHLHDRQLIREHLGSDQIWKDYPEWYPLFRLQYRNILIRPKLYKVATISLCNLIGYNLPHLCTERIFIYLTKEDLKNLIKA